MVIWGQSAGANSVSYYPYSWYFDPIVKGVISDSGSAYDFKFDHNFTSFTNLAGLVGCGGLGADDELACMQQVDAEKLEQLVSNPANNLTFKPQAENVTMFSNLEERISNGLIAQIVSRTRDHTSYWSKLHPLEK
jgi:hypothetical protein